MFCFLDLCVLFDDEVVTVAVTDLFDKYEDILAFVVSIVSSADEYNIIAGATISIGVVVVAVAVTTGSIHSHLVFVCSVNNSVAVT